MNTATTDPAAASDEAVQRIVRFFDTMTPQSLQQLADIYTEAAYFKDPFHEVRGLAPIEGIYRHMYEALDAPRAAMLAALVRAPTDLDRRPERIRERMGFVLAEMSKAGLIPAGAGGQPSALPLPAFSGGVNCPPRS